MSDRISFSVDEWKFGKTGGKRSFRAYKFLVATYCSSETYWELDVLIEVACFTTIHSFVEKAFD